MSEAVSSAKAASPKPLFGAKGVALFAVSTAAVALLIPALDATRRGGAGIGLACAGVGSAIALALLWLSYPRGLNRVLGALVVAFLLRMLLVAAGLLAASAAGADLIGFAVGFFGLFLAHQLIEIGLLARHSRAGAAEGSA